MKVILIITNVLLKGGKNVTTDKFASYKELTTKGGKDVTTEKFANYKEVTAQGGTESTTHEKNSSNTRTSDMVNKVTNDTSQASTHTGSVTDTKSDTRISRLLIQQLVKSSTKARKLSRVWIPHQEHLALMVLFVTMSHLKHLNIIMK